eukprot:233951-Chlamydomonas_euryale.AAC.2
MSRECSEEEEDEQEHAARMASRGVQQGRAACHLSQYAHAERMQRRGKGGAKAFALHATLP